MDKLPFYRNFCEQPAMRYEDLASEERVSKDLEMMAYKIHLFLDLGCGDGTILDQLSSYFFKVALDISYNMLVRLKT